MTPSPVYINMIWLGYSLLDINFAVNFMQPTSSLLILQQPPISKRLIEFPTTDAFTISLWLNVNSTTFSGSSQISSVDLFHYISLQQQNNQFRMSLRNDSALVLRISDYESEPLQVNNLYNSWTHICCRLSNNGQLITFHVNGTLTKKTSDNVTLPVYPGVLMLGEENLIGSITNFFVHSRMLSEEEIIESYKSHPPLKGVTVGWWLFKGQAKSSRGHYVETDQFGFDY